MLRISCLNLGPHETQPIEGLFDEIPLHLFTGPSMVEFPPETDLRIENEGRNERSFVIEDLSFLSGYPTIVSLEIIVCRVKSLDGIQYLPNLQSLKITQFEAPNLNGIEYCTDLQELFLMSSMEYRGYIDITHINSLPLTSLELRSIPASDFCFSRLDLPLLQTLHVSEELFLQMPGKLCAPNITQFSFSLADKSAAAEFIDPNYPESEDHRLEEYSPIKWLLDHVTRKRHQISLIDWYLVTIRFVN